MGRATMLYKGKVRAQREGGDYPSLRRSRWRARGLRKNLTEVVKSLPNRSAVASLAGTRPLTHLFLRQRLSHPLNPTVCRLYLPFLDGRRRSSPMKTPSRPRPRRTPKGTLNGPQGNV